MSWEAPDKALKEEHRLRTELIEVCQRLDEYELLYSTFGNVSVRVDDGLLITPSRIPYADLIAEHIVLVSLAGEVRQGTQLPSSELEIHRQIYVSREDVGAVVHTHSIFAAAVATTHQEIPPILEEQSQLLGGRVLSTPYVPASQHERLGAVTVETLGDSQAVLLANHGAVACGRTLQDAELAALVLERVSRINLLVGDEAQRIPADFVVSERERWLYRYGSVEDGAVVASGDAS